MFGYLCVLANTHPRFIYCNAFICANVLYVLHVLFISGDIFSFTYVSSSIFLLDFFKLRRTLYASRMTEAFTMNAGGAIFLHLLLHYLL